MQLLSVFANADSAVVRYNSVVESHNALEGPTLEALDCKRPLLSNFLVESPCQADVFAFLFTLPVAELTAKPFSSKSLRAQEFQA